MLSVVFLSSSYFPGSWVCERAEVHGVKEVHPASVPFIVQELCESRGGRPGLSVLTSLLVSVDVKLY